MTGTMSVNVPEGDARVRAALGSVLVAATGFVAFAWTTTQVKSVRAASPWQDDPYDMVVSFTEFLVPALLGLIAVRMALRLGTKPQPTFRTVQLLRASMACTAFIAATVVADWAAVVLRADRSAWSSSITALLVGALALVTVGVVADLVILWKPLRRLPSEHVHDGDWLDDLVPLLTLLTGCKSEFWTRRCSPTIAFVRRRIVAVTAAVTMAAGLAVTMADAIGEGWTDPLHFVLVLTLITAGFLGTAISCNRYLVVVARPPAYGRVRRALRAAGVAGAFGLPATFSIRDEILHLVGDDNDNIVAHLLLLSLTGAAAIATTAFLTVLVPRRSHQHHQHL